MSALALKLTPSSDGFGLFAFAFLRWFLVIPSQLHFSENAFSLHFFLKNS